MKSRKFNIQKALTVSLIAILIGLLIPQIAGAAVPPGTDPNYPIVINLEPQDVDFIPGHLAAGQETWLAVKVSEIGGELRQPLDLSLFVAPGEGNAIQKVHMDLFSGSYAHYWSVGNLEDTGTFGEGRIVEPKEGGDPLLGELVWSGHVNNNEMVFVCLINHNDFAVDYWFYTDNIIDAEFGQAAEAVVAPYIAPGTDPNNTLALTDGLTLGELAPGGEHWYAVTASDLDEAMLEQMHLSFYFTPNTGNNLQRVHLDIFDSGQNQIWSRGDEIVNMGAGTVVHRDDNPQTGELFWSGWLIDNDMYYVCVRNDSDELINYWLFTDDVINPNVGELVFY